MLLLHFQKDWKERGKKITVMCYSRVVHLTLLTETHRAWSFLLSFKSWALPSPSRLFTLSIWKQKARTHFFSPSCHGWWHIFLRILLPPSLCLAKKNTCKSLSLLLSLSHRHEGKEKGGGPWRGGGGIEAELLGSTGRAVRDNLFAKWNALFCACHCSCWLDDLQGHNSVYLYFLKEHSQKSPHFLNNSRFFFSSFFFCCC